MNETFAAWLEHPVIAQVIWLGALGVAWAILDLVLRHGILRFVERLVLRTSTDWDDVLHEAKIFERLTPLIPALLAWYGATLVPEVGESFETLVRKISVSVILLVAARTFGAFLTAANALYARRPENAHRPIKGYIQVLRILVAVVTTILILATLLDESPVFFLSGLGAMTAVILLIFRDTILSLVASVQITSNDMIRVGDWIEMPQFGADGDVDRRGPPHGEGPELGQDGHHDPDPSPDLRLVQELALHVRLRRSPHQALDPHRRGQCPIPGRGRGRADRPVPVAAGLHGRETPSRSTSGIGRRTGTAEFNAEHPPAHEPGEASARTSSTT